MAIGNAVAYLKLLLQHRLNKTPEKTKNMILGVGIRLSSELA
jgi:hypothetical protein